MKKLTTEEFIERAIKVHGEKYDYSKVEYNDIYTPVCIICPKHGEFWQAPNAHINGKHGCIKCWSENKRLGKEEFIKRSIKIYGNKYDYSEVEYVGGKIPVKIICPKHGEFLQRIDHHLNGCGCPKCSRCSTTEKFIEKAKEIHGDTYDYSKVEYINSTTKVCIICKVHGEFWQTPADHLKGSGCPICNSSKLEEFIKNKLQENDIKYIYQYKLTWLKSGSQYYSLDFFLPKYNVGIECQGLQHFEPVAFFGGEIGYKNTIKRDLKKFNSCKNKGIHIFYYTNIIMNKYPYPVITNFNDLISVIKKME